MSKAEKFIQDYTRICSNENGGWILMVKELIKEG